MPHCSTLCVWPLVNMPEVLLQAGEEARRQASMLLLDCELMNSLSHGAKKPTKFWHRIDLLKHCYWTWCVSRSNFTKLDVLCGSRILSYQKYLLNLIGCGTRGGANEARETNIAVRSRLQASSQSLLTYLLTCLLTYLLTYLLHGAESFLRS